MIKMIGGFIAASTCLVALQSAALRSETVRSESHKAVTFSRDVAPILYAHCVKCHHAGDIAPMSLLTYKEVRPWAAAIKQAVITRKMPPWKADEHYGDWSNDSRLSARDISILTSWADGQKLEGDQSEIPAPPNFNEGWRIGQPDLVISIPERQLAATGPDEYAYIDVPTHFTEDRWIKAAELRPGNRKIVHHAHVFVKEQEDKAAASKEPSAEYARWLILRQGTLEWLRPEAPVIDNGCAVDDNGLLPGSKIANLGNLISSYLPGRDAEVFPDGTARLIKAGASLNFQIHYSRTSGKTEVDSTSVGFVFAKQPPMKVLHMTSISSQMFRVPAGDPDHRVTECHTFPTAIEITSLTPHMHLRGKAMRYVAHFPNGEVSTLLYVPDYDFNWQFTYLARKPILIPKGTRIEVVAEFDNSANNPVNPNFKEPVRWGAASENEMMDGWIEYVDAEVEPASSGSTRADLPAARGSLQQ